MNSLNDCSHEDVFLTGEKDFYICRNCSSIFYPFQYVQFLLDGKKKREAAQRYYVQNAQLAEQRYKELKETHIATVKKLRMATDPMNGNISLILQCMWAAGVDNLEQLLDYIACAEDDKKYA